MTCYNETRGKDDQYHPRQPRDGNNVREIAEDARCFIGHVRPLRYVEGSEQEQAEKE